MPRKPTELPPLALQVRENLNHLGKTLAPEPLFRDDPESADTDVAIAAWAMLDEFITMANERKQAYRKVLLERAESAGAPTSKGGQSMWADDNEVIREKRQGKKPAEEGLRTLLKEKQIAPGEVFDEVKVSQMNMSKIQYLIDTGKVSEKEISDLCKVSWALKVNKSDDIEKILNDFSNTVLGLPMGTKRLSLKKSSDSDE
jgi:hypothetical protein